MEIPNYLSKVSLPEYHVFTRILSRYFIGMRHIVMIENENESLFGIWAFGDSRYVGDHLLDRKMANTLPNLKKSSS